MDVNDITNVKNHLKPKIMEQIKTIEELRLLQYGSYFYVIMNGNINSFIYAGPHPKETSLAIGISSANFTKAEVFSSRHFGDHSIVLTGEYDSKEVGAHKITQLQKNIESVKKIYLNTQL